MENVTPSAPNRILRVPEVCQITGLARPTIYLYIRRGSFPKPIKLTDKAVGWQQSDIDAWIEARRSASQSASGAPSTTQNTNAA